MKMFDRAICCERHRAAVYGTNDSVLSLQRCFLQHIYTRNTPS